MQTARVLIVAQMPHSYLWGIKTEHDQKKKKKNKQQTKQNKTKQKKQTNKQTNKQKVHFF
jgi:hypothetical protein